MAIFGWVCLVIMMLAITASWFIVWLNHAGRWTIGGAKNSLVARITINSIGAGIFFTWYMIGSEAPFVIVLK